MEEKIASKDVLLPVLTLCGTKTILVEGKKLFFNIFFYSEGAGLTWEGILLFDN